MKNKILYFSDCHIYGGSDQVIINLLNYIAEHSEAEVFFAYRYFETYQKGVNRDLSKKVKAIPLTLLSNSTFFHRLDQKINNRLLNKILKYPFWILDKIGIYVIYNYLVLRKIFLQIKPNLIHINNGGYPASFVCQTAIIAAKYSGFNKIVYHINNPATKQIGFFDKFIDKKINQYTDYFITASKKASKSLSQNRYFDNKKLIQIYNSVKEPIIVSSRADICKTHHIDFNKIIIVEVAFLSQRKGQIYLLNALRQIKKNHPDIYSQLVLFFVGNGEDFFKLKKYCELHGLQNVIFTGYLDHDADYIACADIFILPSTGQEDMPLVVLTAMKLGKPIIATEVAGIVEEIENQKSGSLIRVENLDNLDLEIVKLYRDSNLRHYYAENALRRFNEHFSPSQVYRKVQALYEKLLAID